MFGPGGLTRISASADVKLTKRTLGVVYAPQLFIVRCTPNPGGNVEMPLCSIVSSLLTTLNKT